MTHQTPRNDAQGQCVRDRAFFARDWDLLGWRYVATTINFTMLRDHTTAAAFLHQAALDVPEFAPELTRAAECYRQVKLLVGPGIEFRASSRA